MQSLLHFSYNLLFFGVACIVNIWLEGISYWYIPNLIFLAAVWLQFVSGKLNYFALILFSLLIDVYLGNTFGSQLIALVCVLYFIGMANFSEQSQSHFVGCVMLFFGHLVLAQTVLFINFGLNGLIKQPFVLIIGKSLITSLIWVACSLAFRNTRKRMFEL